MSGYETFYSDGSLNKADGVVVNAYSSLEVNFSIIHLVNIKAIEFQCSFRNTSCEK